MTRFTRTILSIGVSLVTLASCGSDDSSADPTTTVAAETSATTATSSNTPDSTGDSVDTSTTTATDLGPTDSTPSTGGEPATKIVSLSPTHTEILFAIGAGSQVIAVDDQSNYPADAAAVKSDLSGYTPSVEAIAGYQPDLVVIADDSADITPQLEALDIPVWSGPSAASFDDVYEQIEQLGAVTGHVGEAAELVKDMQVDIEAALAELPETEVPMTYYHELDPTYFSVTSDTFIGQIYSLAGLQNIADQANATTSYPQLSSELIVSANPDLIFLADTKCCGESQETVAVRDGWSGIAAVANGNVIAMDDDIASRWGPRIVDYLRAVVDAVKQASAVVPG